MVPPVWRAALVRLLSDPNQGFEVAPAIAVKCWVEVGLAMLQTPRAVAPPDGQVMRMGLYYSQTRSR